MPSIQQSDLELSQIRHKFITYNLHQGTCIDMPHFDERSFESEHEGIVQGWATDQLNSLFPEGSVAGGTHRNVTVSPPTERANGLLFANRSCSQRKQILNSQPSARSGIKGELKRTIVA